ncbi:MAG: ATP-dependent DNA helicase RecG [Chloroflexi bacterium]|nr:ATP-dependent DNA helicase RecG [Chloroflexota bacterium]
MASPNPLEQLSRVLDLEAQRGWKNDAVIGGLEEYAARWRQQMTPYAQDKDSTQLLAQIVQMLTDYPLLPLDARPSTIRHLQASVAELQKRTRSLGKKKAARTGKKRGTPKSEREGQTSGVGHRRSARMLQQESGLQAPLTTLPGVGPSMAKTLARLNLHQVGDLLWHLPFRYQDYSNLRPIAQLRVGDEVTIRATVRKMHSRRTKGRRKLTTAILSDSTGSIRATFWNPYIDRALHIGQDYYFSGKVGSYMNQRVLESPEFEPASTDPTHTARIVPIYPLTEGLAARTLRKLIRRVVEAWAGRLPDPLPAELRQRLNFPSLGASLQQVHFPDDRDALERARKRLAFDELLIIQLGVLRQHRAWQSKPAQPLTLRDEDLQAFLDSLPFTLTRAQQRVLADIRRDIARDYPMTRLLQGDVGSGKTVVAAAAMWAAVCNGAQAALMAPTEILAEQHYRKLKAQFAQLLHPRTGWPLRVDLLTGSVTGKRREAILAALLSGDVDILIGTHALIQESVQFRDLALIVVDEQHRFGVAQRAALREKGATLNAPERMGANKTPHTLVMSATPIPRTLALTIYGDMDVSAIDELPPGRRPIKTYWVKPEMRNRVYKFIAEQVAEGRQAFIIYPLVEESEALEDVGAAVAEHKRLSEKVFPQLRVALLHGRLTGKEKDAIMRAFAAGEYDILVSTAVVEVGIDVPNASVMLIENAERFGLAQLHQFRGRVGRGPHQSYCILISEPKSDQGMMRMRAMEKSQDGFELAEIDLRMRGPGEFFGTRQSGLPDLKLARLSDARLLELARREAETILAADPELAHPEHQLLAQQTAAFWSQEIDLS